MTERGRAKVVEVGRASVLTKKRDVGQRSAGHRSSAGSNYGDYVPSRSKQGVQRGGEDRVDASKSEAVSPDQTAATPSTALTDIPLRGADSDNTWSGSSGT